MLGSLRHCIPAANRGHRCHLRSNTTTSLLHVRYIRLYGPEPYALWLLSPPAASPLLPSPSPAVPDLQVGSCAGYPARSFACPAPANLREAETGASVASFSACAGNGGVCGTAAELPPQLRDLPITQAWVDLEHHQLLQRRSGSGRRRTRLRFLNVTVPL